MTRGFISRNKKKKSTRWRKAAGYGPLLPHFPSHVSTRHAKIRNSKKGQRTLDGIAAFCPPLLRWQACQVARGGGGARAPPWGAVGRKVTILRELIFKSERSPCVHSSWGPDRVREIGQISHCRRVTQMAGAKINFRFQPSTTQSKSLIPPATHQLKEKYWPVTSRENVLKASEEERKVVNEAASCWSLARRRLWKH